MKKAWNDSPTQVKKGKVFNNANLNFMGLREDRGEMIKNMMVHPLSKNIYKGYMVINMDNNTVAELGFEWTPDIPARKETTDFSWEGAD